jgi:ABC-type polysaccharide/polyol phosphate transport system ATPase subunit
MAHIELHQVSLTFRIRPLGRLTLKEFLLGALRRTPNPLMEIQALREVSLQVREGQRLGIIGPNGAGKSSLLKTLAGVYTPTAGECRVDGQVTSLFDITLGFEGDSNGWDNIAYRSFLQGETRRSIKPKLKPIAEFSELGRFLDVPVRYYSSGMLFRLAFSIATAIDPEILLMDEVFSVGDLAFQEKARQRMQEMMARARLIVVVSHDLNNLPRMCERAIWLDQGRVRQMGPVQDVIQAYAGSVRAGPPQAA